MRLSPAAFNSFLTRNIGQDVLWRASFSCPCISPHSGAARPNCPLCSGKGRIWSAPIKGKSGVSQQQGDPQFQQFGTLEQGDTLLSVPNNSPLYDMGRFDRVTLLNSTDVFSRTMVRGQHDDLSDITVQSVTRVFWLNGDRDAIVEGGIPSVGPGGVLTWESGEPPQGVEYSITGLKFDDYFVWQALPSDRNAHFGAPLPKKVMIRRWDLFGR